MAYPNIIFDTAGNGGSDASASGAGPGDGVTSGSAITGSNAFTRNAASQSRIGFFEGSPPSMTGVATDGSHALFVNTGSGRQTSKITAVNVTSQTVFSNATVANASPTVTMNNTSGFSAGDLVKVTDGTTTLYSTVSSVSANVSITLADNWTGSSGSTATVTDPVQVTVEDASFQVTSATGWAIGGRKLTLTGSGSAKLFGSAGDLKAGWTCTFNAALTPSATTTLPNVGDTTNGVLTVQGATEQVSVTTTANVACFTVGTGRYRIKSLALSCSSGTRNLAYGVTTGASGGYLELIDCVLGDSVHQLQKGVYTASSMTSLTVSDCEVKNCVSHGIDLNNNAHSSVSVRGNNLHNNGGSNVANFGGATVLNIDKNTVWAATTDGIATSTGSCSKLSITRNVIHGNTNGVNLGSGSMSAFEFWGNDVTGNTTGVTGSNTVQGSLTTRFDYNNYGTGGTANTTDVAAGSGLVKGSHDLNVDPAYSNAASGNFTTPGTAGTVDKGWPDASRTIGGNAGATTTHETIGASQPTGVTVSAQPFPGMSGFRIVEEEIWV